MTEYVNYKDLSQQMKEVKDSIEARIDKEQHLRHELRKEMGVRLTDQGDTIDDSMKLLYSKIDNMHIDFIKMINGKVSTGRFNFNISLFLGMLGGMFWWVSENFTNINANILSVYTDVVEKFFI